jgi:phosphate-selective porin OprO/OprP
MLVPVAGRADDQAELVEKLLDRIEQLEKKVEALETGGTNTTTSVPPADADALEALDQKIRVLERKDELDKEAAAEKARKTPSVTVGDSGLVARSPDTNFVFALRGVLQVDSRTFFGNETIQGNDGFLLRRARPILQGTVFRDFDFMFVPDFGGSSVVIQDAYLNYRYEPWMQLRAGKYKVPIGLEQLQSDPVTLFNERSLVTDLVPNRDIGFQLWGDIAGGLLNYAAGVFNGVGDSRNTSNVDFDDNREFAGRLFVQPFRNSDTRWLQKLGVGVAGSWGNSVSNAAGLPNNNGYATDGQQLFFAYTNGVADGTHWRVSPQAYYYYGPFGLLAEYVISNQRVSRTVAPLSPANHEHTAWQVSASWVLTGEDTSFSGVTPKRPFDPREGKWGAIQLVGRYAELDVDNDAFSGFANPDASASAAQAWSVGLNWYLNRNIRANANYSRTVFTDGGASTASSAPAAVTRQPEEVFFTRLQLAF